MQRLSPVDLQDEQRFQLLCELGHHELIPFVQTYYLFRRSTLVWSHYLLSLAALGAWIWAGWQAQIPPPGWILALGWASLLFLALVPLHEALHGLAYWLQGARDIRYKVSLRGLYAYAIAHQFVVDRRALTWAALAPFLGINGGLLLLATWEPVRFLALAVLFIHMNGTSGDWAILNYIWSINAPLYSFDDAQLQKSYFYSRLAPPPPGKCTEVEENHA